MQAVAAEVNLAETAFLVPRADGDHDLRWFTPTVEVDLCGHATLASAHVLGGTNRFHTRSGVLTCEAAADGVDHRSTCPPPRRARRRRRLGRRARPGTGPGRGRLGGRRLGARGGGDRGRCARPPCPAATALLDFGGHAIVAADTTADDAVPFDSVCRTFVPAAGIDEDPVTGSAHCVLAPVARRPHRPHRRSSAARRRTRGGTIGMELRGDRVVLRGTAVTVSVGQLLVDPS